MSLVWACPINCLSELNHKALHPRSECSGGNFIPSGDTRYNFMSGSRYVLRNAQDTSSWWTSDPSSFTIANICIDFEEIQHAKLMQFCRDSPCQDVACNLDHIISLWICQLSNPRVFKFLAPTHVSRIGLLADPSSGVGTTFQTSLAAIVPSSLRTTFVQYRRKQGPSHGILYPCMSWVVGGLPRWLFKNRLSFLVPVPCHQGACLRRSVLHAWRTLSVGCHSVLWSQGMTFRLLSYVFAKTFGVPPLRVIYLTPESSPPVRVCGASHGCGLVPAVVVVVQCVSAPQMRLWPVFATVFGSKRLLCLHHHS